MSSEHAAEMLRRGQGHASVHMNLNLSPSDVTTGLAVGEVRFFETVSETHEKFVAVDQLIVLLRKLLRSLESISPHPRDVCIAAIAVGHIRSLKISLVRVLGRNRDLHERPIKDVADEEVAIASPACKRADEIMLLNEKSRIDLETFGQQIGRSDNPDMTMAALRLAVDQRMRLVSDQGTLIGRNPRPLPAEIRASASAYLEGYVVATQGTERMTLRLCDSNVESPYSNLGVRDVQLHVPNASDQWPLMSAMFIAAKVRIKAATVYHMPRANDRHGSGKATVISVDNRAQLTERANAEYSVQLDLGTPDSPH